MKALKLAFVFAFLVGQQTTGQFTTCYYNAGGYKFSVVVKGFYCKNMIRI